MLYCSIAFGAVDLRSTVYALTLGSMAQPGSCYLIDPRPASPEWLDESEADMVRLPEGGWGMRRAGWTLPCHRRGTYLMGQLRR